MVEFTDRASVEAWCKERTREEVIVFAVRNAASVYPVVSRPSEWSERHFDFHSCRAILTAAVTIMFDENAVTTAAGSAAISEYAASIDETFAVLSAYAAAAVYACAAASAVGAGTTRTDASVAASGAASAAAGIFSSHTNELFRASDIASQIASDGVAGVMKAPLWNGEAPEELIADWHVIRNERSKDMKVWGFWIDWYEGLLAGRAPDWELWREVALIDDAIWQMGPEAVAEAIAGIKAALTSKRLPLAEDLVADPVTGLFSVVPRDIANLPLLAASLGQVSDAVDDVLAEDANGLRETSSDILKLRRTVERYANDPQRVEMDMTSVSASLLRQVACEDLPASAAILGLQQVVQQTADGLRATHPEIAANRALLQGQARQALSDDMLEQIAQAGPLLEAISDVGLREEMRDDVYELTQAMRVGAPPLGGVLRDGGDEIVRIGGRGARMMLMLRKSPALVHKLEASTGYKAASIVGTLWVLVGLLWAIFL